MLYIYIYVYIYIYRYIYIYPLSLPSSDSTARKVFSVLILDFVVTSQTKSVISLPPVSTKLSRVISGHGRAFHP